MNPTPEQRARLEIDAALEAAGWVVQNRSDMNLAAGLGTDRQDREATWSEKTPEGRWRSFSYDEVLARDKVSLDLFWLRDESLEDSASLPEPHVLVQEVADANRSALGQIEDVLGDLEQRVPSRVVDEAGESADR